MLTPLGFHKISRSAIHAISLPQPQYLLPISSRNGPYDGDDASFSSGFGDSAAYWQARVIYTNESGGDINGFKVDYSSYRQPATGGAEAYSLSHTVKCKLEYPIGGPLYDFTWSGATSKVISGSLATIVNTSEELVLPSHIPNGAQFAIHSQYNGGTAWSQVPDYRINLALGDTYNEGTGTPPTLGGPYSGSVDKRGAVQPTKIFAKQTTQKPFVCFMGDSITVDQQYNRDAKGLTNWPSAIDGLAYSMKFSRSGNTLASAAAASNIKLTLMQSYGASRVFILLGTNDISASVDNSSTVISNYQTLAAAIRAKGMIPHLMTIPPRPTHLGVTTINDWIRSVSNTGDFGKHFELADVLETSRNSTVWKTNYHTGDSIHINWGYAPCATAVKDAFRAYFQTL